MTGLVTRAPAGVPSWPLVLVEGPERAGKLAMAVSLGADARVGRVLVVDVTGQADELAGSFEIIDTNGTYADLLEKVRAATELPPHEARPNVVVVDGTELWELLKRRVDARARRSKAARRVLADDPDAAIDAPQNLWVDAKDQWAAVVGLLRRFPGIGIVTAVSGEAPRYADGVPVAGESDWSIQAEKTVTRAASVWVRVLRHPHRVMVMAATSRPDLALSPDGAPVEGSFADLLFGDLGGFVDHATAGPTVGLTVAAAKRHLVHQVETRMGLAGDDATAEAARLWEAFGCTSAEVAPAELAALLATVGAAPGPVPADPEFVDDVEPDADPVLVARGEGL